MFRLQYRAAVVLLLLFILATFVATQARAELSLTTVTESAWDSNINGVSFQQDAVISYKGWQYAVYWSENQHVGVARRKLPDGSWENLELPDYTFTGDNAHYDISLGISKADGRLHLSFDQWSSRFAYRRSVANLLDRPEQFAWTASVFGAVQSHLVGATLNPTTYPRFVNSKNQPLLFMQRVGISGGGDSMLYEYDENNGRWVSLGMFVNGLATDVNAYFNGLDYDNNGRLHATWVWRATPNASTNFNLNYAYSDDRGRTWYNDAGQRIAVTGRSPIVESTPGLSVWRIDQNRGLINQESQTVVDGRVHVLVSHMRPESASDSNFESARHKAYAYHYWREGAGRWHRQVLPGSTFGYDRNKITHAEDGTLYAVIDRDGIYRAKASENYRWQLVHSVTDVSQFGEVQLDRLRMADENRLSIYWPASPGRMVMWDFIDRGERSNAIAGRGPKGYIYCAHESGTCIPPSPRDVAYGADGVFRHTRANGAIACNPDSFGADPIRGVVKRCYYAETTENTDTPVGYSYCAGENQSCRFNGTQQVAYGANGVFHYRLASDEIACNNTEFGDPINGVAKNCYRYDEPLPDSSSSSSFSSPNSSSSKSSLNSSQSSNALTSSSLASSSISPSSSSSALSLASSSAQSSTCQRYCDWYGRAYPLCTRQGSGWGWEKNASCITVATCDSQNGSGGVVDSCSQNSASTQSSSSMESSSSLAVSASSQTTTSSSAASHSSFSSSLATISSSASSSSANSRSPGSSTSVSSSNSSISPVLLSCSTSINSWPGGFVTSVEIFNDGTEAVSGWNAHLSFNTSVTVTGSWGAELLINGADIDASYLSYNGNLAPGQKITFGFQGGYRDSISTPVCTASAQ